MAVQDSLLIVRGSSAAQMPIIGGLLSARGNDDLGVQAPQARGEHSVQLAGDGGKLQYIGAWGAAALEDAHIDVPSRSERHQGPQRRRRGFPLGVDRPEQENGRLAGLGVHLQAPDLQRGPGAARTAPRRGDWT